MYIVFGETHDDGELHALDKEPCPSCTKPTLSAFTRFRLFHIAYIPFFPIGRRRLTSCSTCECEFTRRLGGFLDDGPPPPYRVFHFAGLILTGLILLAVTLFGPDRSQAAGPGTAGWTPSARTVSLARDPRVGDIFVMTAPEDESAEGFVAARVVDVTTAAVTIRFALLVFPSPTDVARELDGALAVQGNWDSRRIPIPYPDLQQEVEDGSIVFILRP